MELSELKEMIVERYGQWAAPLETVEIVDSLEVDPADNDGRMIRYNSRRFQFFTPETQCFYLAQQMLHLMLAHTARGVGKDPAVWRRATDAVTAEMLRADGFQPPALAEVVPEAASGSAEAVYAALMAREPERNADQPLPVEVRPQRKRKQAGDETDAKARTVGDMGVAEAVAGLKEFLQPSQDVDYDWFPGDTIRHGMIRDEFRPYRVSRAEILIDTSNSVDEALLKTFLRGVKALLHDAVVRVGCFDTRFYGFQDVSAEHDIENLRLEGAGGTNFEVAVDAFTGDAENQIIFTDGYGEMPVRRCDAVWVVYGTMRVDPPGGRVIYVDPFGKAYKLRDEKDSFAAEKGEWLLT